MIRATVTGAGRMGLSIQRLADSRSDIDVVRLWRRGEDLADAIADADVVIDFSLPEATTQIATESARQQKPLVCGVSGLDAIETGALRAAAEKTPVLYDRNMSFGIAVLDVAIRDVGRSLSDGFDIRIEETHHVHKKDAPSGTALKLGESLIDVGAAETQEDIDYHSEREGEVPGDHSIVFESATERLEFRHSVTTRDVFAEGALRAAIWLAGQPPGWYSMRDVLFGND
ncbi:MAG: 4-hydroxy-tetrahydrodipicolinate reductase [Woeseiaceae bacterium]|nr:4-hydroxy-tetrahydrodipicolinate reductase [Woeseiaceae bacterium]